MVHVRPKIFFKVTCNFKVCFDLFRNLVKILPHMLPLNHGGCLENACTKSGIWQLSICLMCFVIWFCHLIRGFPIEFSSEFSIFVILPFSWPLKMSFLLPYNMFELNSPDYTLNLDLMNSCRPSDLRFAS